MMKIAFPEKLEKLKVREVQVEGSGVLNVPTHVTRIDIEKTNTHGWQVRFEKPSTFFSDTAYGGAVESLQEAISFLASIYYPKLVKRPTVENKNKKIPLGIRGVRLVKMKKKNRNTEELYAEAIPMRRGMSAKRFYIGTSNTATPERMEEAISKAKKCRQRFELDAFFC
ncbi:MAG: hypothetical protein V4525_10820 [Pseudomonadota bacterium]